MEGGSASEQRNSGYHQSDIRQEETVYKGSQKLFPNGDTLLDKPAMAPASESVNSRSSVPVGMLGHGKGPTADRDFLRSPGLGLYIVLPPMIGGASRSL